MHVTCNVRRSFPSLIFFPAEIIIGLYQNLSRQGPNVYSLGHGILAAAFTVNQFFIFYLSSRDARTRQEPSSALYVSLFRKTTVGVLLLSLLCCQRVHRKYDLLHLKNPAL